MLLQKNIHAEGDFSSVKSNYGEDFKFCLLRPLIQIDILRKTFILKNLHGKCHHSYLKKKISTKKEIFLPSQRKLKIKPAPNCVS